jgi:hypothetical protein
MSVILQWLSDSAIQFGKYSFAISIYPTDGYQGLMKRTAKIVVLGLDNSGKSVCTSSTLTYMLVLVTSGVDVALYAKEQSACSIAAELVPL